MGSGKRVDPFDVLGRYVALLVYQDGGLETFVEAAGSSLCEAAREHGLEEAFNYMLIGIARALEMFDNDEARYILARLETREGQIAEYVAEKIAERAHELIRTQSPKFYRAALEYIRRRCGL